MSLCENSGLIVAIMPKILLLCKLSFQTRSSHPQGVRFLMTAPLQCAKPSWHHKKQPRKNATNFVPNYEIRLQKTNLLFRGIIKHNTEIGGLKARYRLKG